MSEFNSCCKKLRFLLFFLAVSCVSMAQRTVSGKVVSSDNKQPLPGATVVVKGGKATTVTNANGEFSITADEKYLLITTNVGYGIREVKATESGAVALTSEARTLDDVVVTALGIKREEKSLGFAAQTVKENAVPYEVHIPLIVSGPGFKKGVELDAPTSNVDIVPTILQLQHIPVPASMDGRVIDELLIEPTHKKTSSVKKEIISTRVKTDWGIYELLLERSVSGKYSYINFAKVIRTLNSARQ